MPSSVISQAVPYFDTDASKEDFGFTVLTERMEHVQYLRNWPFATCTARPDLSLLHACACASCARIYKETD